MRILFTICGRAGSKGIPHKNLRDFLGKPLPYYSLSAIDLFLKEHPETDYRIVVNSDSQELLELMKKNSLRPLEVIVRDASLAGDTIGKVAVIRNCLEEMEVRMTEKYDMVVDLDITSPLRRVCDIESLVQMHFQKQPDVTTSVVPARRNPYFNQVKKVEKGVQKVIPSEYVTRQQAPEIYDMNASLYAYSTEFLRNAKSVLEGYCEIIEMYDTGILDLDHENDFELMEVIAGYLFQNHPQFGEIRKNLE